MNPIIRKLERYAPLAPRDQEVLTKALEEPYELPGRHMIVRQGESPDAIHVVIKGIAHRSMISADGDRFIMGFLVPGDFCDLRLAVLRQADHTITTLTPCVVARIPRAVFATIIARPSIARALWIESLSEERALLNWIARLGGGDAREKLAHLLCDLFFRLRAMGHTEGDSFVFPAVQQDLADATGLSVVHLNRVLQSLRADGLIDHQGKRLTILDIDGLVALSGYVAEAGKGNMNARPRGAESDRRPATP